MRILMTIGLLIIGMGLSAQVATNGTTYSKWKLFYSNGEYNNSKWRIFYRNDL